MLFSCDAGFRLVGCDPGSRTMTRMMLTTQSRHRFSLQRSAPSARHPLLRLLESGRPAVCPSLVKYIALSLLHRITTPASSARKTTTCHASRCGISLSNCVCIHPCLPYGGLMTRELVFELDSPPIDRVKL